MCIPINDDGTTTTRTTIAQYFQKRGLDEKLTSIGAYFFSVSQSEFNEMHRGALILMAERGLIRLLAKILVQFVKWDRREIRTTVKNVSFLLHTTALHQLTDTERTGRT